MIALFVICLFLLALFDAALITGFVTNIIVRIAGDTPLSRLLKVVLGIAVFCGYAYITIYKLLEYLTSTDGNPAAMIILLAIPLVLVVALYIMNGKKEE